MFLNLFLSILWQPQDNLSGTGKGAKIGLGEDLRFLFNLRSPAVGLGVIAGAGIGAVGLLGSLPSVS